MARWCRWLARLVSGLLRPGMRNAFTFVEVAIAMVVLVVGLTAILSLLFVGLDWGREIRMRTTVVNTARAALDDPLLVSSSANPAAYEKVEGYVNGLYVVRDAVEYSEDKWMGASRGGRVLTTYDLADLPGFYANVKVEVYEGVTGGVLSTGNKVYEINGAYYYAP